MEAANRGARKAKGMSIGLNISLPMEQNPNPYQTKELSFEFHYFFIRKFWFFYLAKALVIFPGGFGTFDELFELLTLIQTEKTKKYMPVVLYGKDYWNKVINFEEMVSWGTISRSDLKLFRIVDTIEEAFEYLTTELSRHYFNIDSPHT
jgi:Predicted Rossmann fold nucleotide-binding protein